VTGCPILVNTSFKRAQRADRLHARGRVPLLHWAPRSIFWCVGNCALRKADQDASLARDYRDEFEPD